MTAPAPGGETAPGPRRLRWSPLKRPEVDLARLVRRTRLVGLAKFALIALAVGLVGLVLAWPELVERRQGFRLSYTDVTSNKTGSAMSNVRFLGTDGRNQPFTVTAASASQDPARPNEVRLDQLEADTTIRDGTWLSLSAGSGRYDRDSFQLTLWGGIDLYSDAGFELHTETAVIDFSAGTATGPAPVAGHGPMGRIEAQNFAIRDHGAVFDFGGGVRLTVAPAAAG